MVVINCKRGDTFELACSVPLAFGQTLTSVDCQIRLSSGALLQDLTVTIDTPTSEDYKYTLSATSTETGLWQLGKFQCDIQYTIGAKIASTETFIISVGEDITR